MSLKFYLSCFMICFGAAYVSLLTAQSNWQSQIIYQDGGGHLVYVRDAEGNQIPDFSYAGYKNSEVPIPDVPVVKTISPLTGDNTAHIQNALFEVTLMPKDSTGFRGALLLSAGEYEIKGTIQIKVDGVVLRGVGDGNDPATNTILRATGDTPHQRTVILGGGGGTTKWSDAVPGSYRNIVSDSVLVGQETFEVDDSSPYSVGDNVVVKHPCTQEWLTAIDSGGTYWTWPGAEPGVDVPWTVGSQPIVYNRYVQDIQGNMITIDAPVFNHLIRGLSQSQLYVYARGGLRTHIGIENLRIDIEVLVVNDENHAWNAIDLFQVEDAWVRNCTMLHFGHSAVRTNTATRITVENCRGLDPQSEVTGERRYNFNAYTASQQILFKECHATNGRHHFVSNGTSWTSGIVFLDCTSSGAYTSSEPHRRWSQGILYDNLIELDGPRPGYNPRLLGLYCRGYYGTSHGWSVAHAVAWNCDLAAGDLIVQKPPTAQNYAIGCSGANITGQMPPAPFPEPGGYIEGTNTPGLTPRSLFMAQLEERLAVVGVNEKASPSQKFVTEFQLFQNYPNPFNPASNIRYYIAETSFIVLKIYNSLGEEIRNLVSEKQSPGNYNLIWNGRNKHGELVGSGVYLYRLSVDGFSKTRKMILIR